jgi:hypothetical protein
LLQSDSDSEEESYRKKRIFASLKIRNFIIGEEKIKRNRRNNKIRNRNSVLETIDNTWDDLMWRRQMRISKENFYYILDLITPLIQRNVDMATRSSGSDISPRLRLHVTLRILAGASYLDLVWYEISVDHIMEIVIDCCNAINCVLNNLCLPDDKDEVAFRKLEDGFNTKQRNRYGTIITPGTVLAGDGLVVKIKQPSKKEEAQTQKYRNRKCCFAVVAQAFCDSNCIFKYMEVSWPGNTNDVTAYKQTEMKIGFEKKFPIWCNLVLDDAYSSFGGQHLTPFSKYALGRAQKEDEKMYKNMKIYNLLLSGQRVTIERAFGQLVRRWGILWKSIECKRKHVSLIVIVCAKLHNLCVQSWLNAKKSDNDQMIIEEHADIAELYLPSDDQVVQGLNNINNVLNEITEMDMVDDRRISFFTNIVGSGLQLNSNNFDIEEMQQQIHVARMVSDIAYV